MTDYNDNEEGVAADTAAGSSTAMNLSAGCMYDSDSSDERNTKKSRDNVNMITPLELPFSMGTRSAGDYDIADSDKPDAISSNNGNENKSMYQSESVQPPSPFVALHNTKEILNEKNSWFLVQLPTRLPPMQKKSSTSDNGDVAAAAAAAAGGEVDDMVNETPETPSSSDTTNIMNNISEVVVPPVTTSNFDNGLDTIAPGRIGKIVVYKSGRTVLVLDSPDAKKVSYVYLILERTFFVGFKQTNKNGKSSDSYFNQLRYNYLSI
jgi:hypothetical protein